MDLVAFAGLVALLFVKEAGLPVPVPGDLLVLGAGAAAAGSGMAAAAELTAILGAGFAGGSIQFLVVRGGLRERALRFLARVGLPASRLERLATWLDRRGAKGVAVARATPGLRIGAIAASGLAGLRFRGVFLPGLVAGNTLFVGGHFLLGYVAGPTALGLASGVGGVGGGLALFAVAVLLAMVGALAWRRLRAAQRVRAGQPGGRPAAVLPGYGDWTEAACPACLAIAILRPDPLAAVQHTGRTDPAHRAG